MNNGQLDISTIIVVGVVAIIGVILFVAGNVKNKSRLRMMGIAVVMGAGMFLFVASAALREILTALAALFAVIIAAFSIDESRRMRKDSMEREGRDRKERLIDEVVKWLRELEGRIFPKLAPIMSGTEDTLRRIRSSPKIPPKTWLQLEDLDRALGEMDALRECIKEAEYYQKLTSKLDEELSSLMEVIRNNLEQRRQLISKSPNIPIDWSDRDKVSQLNRASTEDDVSHLGTNAGAIRKSILDAVDKAIELKASLIQVS